MSDARTSDLDSDELVHDGSRIVHFGDPIGEARAALASDAVFDLQHLSLIAVDGDDAEEFLQGQLTNDVSLVSASRAQPSAWCSPKGRVLSCIQVLRHDARLLLLLPTPLLDQTLKRLRMYLLRASAVLEDAGASWTCMGAVGEGTESCLAERLGPLPRDADDARSLEGLSVIRLRGRRPRYQIIGSDEAVATLWNACRQGAVAAGADAWTLLDIEAGIASVGPGTIDTFVPQMLNLDRVGAVSFTKGCYVGQEIVARTQHLGRIKRRMYRAYSSSSAVPDPGDMLAAGDDAGSFKAQVVNAAPSPDGGFELLAVIAMDAAGSVPAEGVTLGDGSTLALRDLPYALEDETG